MINKKQFSRLKVRRLGTNQAVAHARQSMANVRLEGLKPSKAGEILVTKVSNGALSADQAIAELRTRYARRA